MAKSYKGKAPKVSIDKRQLRSSLKRLTSGRVDRRSSGYKQMYASAIALVDEIKIVASARIHVSTGNYINNTVITENFDGSLSVRNIAKNPVSGEYYAAHIEYGTAYNGRGYIYPTESKVLKIPIGHGFLAGGQKKSKGNYKGPIVLGDFYYTNRVRGQKSKYIFRDAARNIARKNGIRYNKVA